MNITNKRSYNHRANANRVGEKDIDEKFLVINELRKWQLYGKTDEILYFSKSTNEQETSDMVQNNCKSKEEVFQKYHVHKPDILIDKSIPSFIVEIDGSIHAMQKDYDKMRDEIISLKGFGVLRIANEELRNPRKVVEKLEKKLKELPR